MERALTTEVPIAFRDATEADHRRLSYLVREWWDERPPRLERLWFRHFAMTAVVAEVADGRPMAFAVGFRSTSIEARGVVLLVGVAPSHRRRGLGRTAVDAVIARLQRAGPLTSVEAVVWPGNRAGIRFLEALGFVPLDESRATPLYGVPAIADYDGDGEDRALLELSVRPD